MAIGGQTCHPGRGEPLWLHSNKLLHLLLEFGKTKKLVFTFLRFCNFGGLILSVDPFIVRNNT